MIEKGTSYYRKKAQELLSGAIDMHVHSAPSIFPRRADDRMVAYEAAEANMIAVVIKSHEGDTAARAKILQSDHSLAKVFGGIVLNHFVGGINPAAAEVSLKLGGRFVWLPTISAYNHVLYYNNLGKTFLGHTLKHHAGAGIKVIKETGELIAEMIDIFNLVWNAGAVLCTGHISPEEVLVTAQEFLSGKKGYFVYTHPDLSINRASLEIQQQIVHLGGYIEKMTLSTHKEWGGVSIEEFIHGIKLIGPEHCFLSTDAGGPDRPSSPQTLRNFLAHALNAGLSDDEARTMLVDIPRKLLEL